MDSLPAEPQGKPWRVGSQLKELTGASWEPAATQDPSSWKHWPVCRALPLILFSAFAQHSKSWSESILTTCPSISQDTMIYDLMCYWTRLGLLGQRAAKPIYWPQAVVKQSAAFPARGQVWGEARKTCNSCSKDPSCPFALREGFLKTEGESPRTCVQLVQKSLIGWWWRNRVMFQES